MTNLDLTKSSISIEIEKLYQARSGTIIHAINKMESMQNNFLSSKEEYSESEKSDISKYFNVVAHKYALAFIHLELLWNQSETSRSEIIQTLEDNSTNQNWSDQRHTISSLFLESYLFQSRSLLDVYFKYICFVLRLKQKRFKSTETFLNYLASQNSNMKALEVHNYLKTVVFGKDKWGTLVKGLRDKVTHFDKINYSYEGEEVIWERVTLNWPTLRGLTYDRFAQSVVDNNMFMMFTTISEILYESKWKSG